MHMDIATIITDATYAVTAAAAAAAVLPQGAPGSAWATIRSLIDALALNLGNAKNSPKA